MKQEQHHVSYRRQLQTTSGLLCACNQQLLLTVPRMLLALFTKAPLLSVTLSHLTVDPVNSSVLLPVR